MSEMCEVKSSDNIINLRYIVNTWQNSHMRNYFANSNAVYGKVTRVNSSSSSSSKLILGKLLSIFHRLYETHTLGLSRMYLSTLLLV